jgi:cyclic pyranopterin monophosphate synthase
MRSSKLSLSHIDGQGKARMVDVSEKAETDREAKAYGNVSLSRPAFLAIKSGKGPKGDILAVAKIAGIMGAKKAHQLVPLCHPLSLNAIDIQFKERARLRSIEIIATIKSRGRTGVEMEALTAVTICALTVYDMCKAIDKTIELGPFYLLEKSGGKSGIYRRSRAK